MLPPITPNAMEPFRWMLSLLWLSAEVNAGPSTIDVGYTKYRGVELSNGITQWLGMRFAAPPTGQLRFKPPQEPDREDGVRDANKVCVSATLRTVQI